MTKDITFENIIEKLPIKFLKKLNLLKELRERPDFHPEKSCFEHIKIVTNRAIKFGDNNLIMAGILHDIHKLDCAKINLPRFLIRKGLIDLSFDPIERLDKLTDFKVLKFSKLFKIDDKKVLLKIGKKSGFPTSPGHDKASEMSIMADAELREFIMNFDADPDTVAGICGEHMRIHMIGKMRKKKQMNLMNLPFFPKLIAFSRFDDMLLSDDKALEEAKELFDLAIKFQEDEASKEDIEKLINSGKMTKNR